MRLPPRFVLLPVLLTLALAFGGCAMLKKIHLPRHRRAAKEAATPAPAMPLLVGTITLVNESDRFVLIDVGMSAVPRSGTALKAMSGNTETGVVAVGDVRKRPFAIAEIVRGAPRKGDQVFQ